MQQKSFQLSSLAQAHLRAIRDYSLTNFSELQWQKYKARLLLSFQMLAENPELGRSCNDIYPNGFYFPIGKHTAYFSKEDGFILIVAILGQPQLPQKHLL